MVNQPSTFQGEGPMVVCRRMNPQGVNPSLPTVFGTMNKMNDGVGEREEKKWSLKPRR